MWMTFFFLMIRRPPRSTLFPYTTLFRSGLLEDGVDGPQVRLFAVVRGAGDGELLARQAEGVGGPREDERQRLEGLGRGARVDVACRVAHGLDDVTLRVADGDAPAVDALDELPAPEGDERRVLGEPGGEVLPIHRYPSARATIRKSTRSWATRTRAIAAGESPSAWWWRASPTSARSRVSRSSSSPP